MTTTYAFGQQASGRRQWLALGAAAAAVLLLTAVIAVACQARTGGGAGSADGGGSASPSTSAGADGAGGAAAGGDPGGGPGGDEAASDDEDPGDPPGNGAVGDNGGGSDGGGSDGVGPDGGPVTLGSIDVIHADLPVPAGGTVVGAAHCPGGTVVVGGGARMDHVSPETFGTQLRESGPVVTGASQVWRAAATNGATEGRTLRITAFCAAAPPGYEIVSDDVVVAGGGGFVRRVVTCPHDTVALAGGSYVLTPGMNNTARLQESMLASVAGNANTGWLVAVSSTDQQDRTVRISVVCSKAPAGYEVVTATYQVSGGGFVSTPHWCPEGTHVLGAGAGVVGALSGNFRTFLRESGPHTAPGAVYRGWWLALSKAGSQEHTVRVAATCVAAD
jgi:hypothetical protein